MSQGPWNRPIKPNSRPTTGPTGQPCIAGYPNLPSKKISPSSSPPDLTRYLCYLFLKSSFSKFVFFIWMVISVSIFSSQLYCNVFVLTKEKLYRFRGYCASKEIQILYYILIQLSWQWMNENFFSHLMRCACETKEFSILLKISFKIIPSSTLPAVSSPTTCTLVRLNPWDCGDIVTSHIITGNRTSASLKSWGQISHSYFC